MHEADQHEKNCFITLTYDDSHLPAGGTLDKQAFPKFMKRLRKKYPNERIRYYHAGEYGDKFGRPHYHSCLFGFDFGDKTYWTDRSGFPVYRSPELEKLWPQGQSEIGSLTFESAAYVARYIMKKITGPTAADHYGTRQPEYTTMSRKPGIGKKWYDTYKCEVYAADSVIVRGKEMKPPRFYDGLYELQEPEAMEIIKRARRRSRNLADGTPERLESQRRVTEARLSQHKRGLP